MGMLRLLLLLMQEQYSKQAIDGILHDETGMLMRERTTQQAGN
jgi:hypothetical protein